MRLKSNKMKIYISGKISGLKTIEYEWNYYKAEIECHCLKQFEGKRDLMKTISPLKIKPLFGIKRWTFFMISDLIALRKCTHIAMQQNWTDSRGAVIEYFFAKFIFKLEVIML